VTLTASTTKLKIARQIFEQPATLGCLYSITPTGSNEKSALIQKREHQLDRQMLHLRWSLAEASVKTCTAVRAAINALSLSDRLQRGPSPLKRNISGRFQIHLITLHTRTHNTHTQKTHNTQMHTCTHTHI